MVVGILIVSIGLIPIVLALNVNKLYETSKLANFLKIYMALIACWQFYVGTLYFVDVLDPNTVNLLFRFFRIGPVLAIPVIYGIVYHILKEEPITKHHSSFTQKLFDILFNRKTAIFVFLWSVVVYIINWTPLSVTGLQVLTHELSPIEYYFPDYGPLHWVFVIHVSSFILFLILIIFISNMIINPTVRVFLKRFASYSIILFAMGIVNFSPEAGIVTSSLGVVVFSTAIMFEFINFNHKMRLEYYELLERQKKMDYIGNIAGSLMHEVKNTNELIKSFSNMLKKSDTIADRDQMAVDMITKSSSHLQDLTDNYKGYMNASNVEYKTGDVEELINDSIHLSSEMLNDYGAKVHFENRIRPLKAQMNQPNLKQVFINLIKNSLEATPDERENKDISISTTIKDNNITIYFKDNGKGIPPDNWESVFDPFISLDKRGMGFGLPFVKKIMAEHFGDVSIEESTPQGTTFKIEIPRTGSIS